MSALERLVAACEEVFGADDYDWADDEAVMGPLPCAITFGLIRDARAELDRSAGG